MECIWLDCIRDLLDWLNKSVITFPLTDECTLAEMKPFDVPMSCPTLTSSPFFTIASAGAPRHCPNGMMTCLGIGKVIIGLSDESLFSSG